MREINEVIVEKKEKIDPSFCISRVIVLSTRV